MVQNKMAALQAKMAGEIPSHDILSWQVAGGILTAVFVCEECHAKLKKSILLKHST
jgi:hypothetical protein